MIINDEIEQYDKRFQGNMSQYACSNFVCSNIFWWNDEEGFAPPMCRECFVNGVKIDFHPIEDEDHHNNLWRKQYVEYFLNPQGSTDD